MNACQRRSRSVAAVAAGLSLALTALGGGGGGGTVYSNSWTFGGDALWQSDACWSLGLLPTNTHEVYLTNATSKVVTIDASTVGSFPDSLSVRSLTIGAPDAEVNTLLLSNSGTDAVLAVARNLTIAEGGALVVSNGGVRQSSLFNFSVDGNVQLAGGVIEAGALTLGASTPNHNLTVTAGTLSTERAVVGGGGLSHNNTVSISGPAAVWNNRNQLYVGNGGSGNQMTISNGAQVLDYGSGYDGWGYGGIGMDAASSNNVVLVTGNGSLWNNVFDLTVGSSGAGNQLLILDGAQAADGNGILGGNTYATNNLVLVSGANSLWNNTSDAYVGTWGSANRLVVTNAGQTIDVNGSVGYYAGADGNTGLVTGAGSQWNNSGDFTVGNFGSGNQLMVEQGGRVTNVNGFIGFDASVSNNAVLVTGADSRWINGGDLTVGRGGSGNHLLIAGGAEVASGAGYVGTCSNANYNAVVVNGAASLWRVGGTLVIASNGLGNTVTVSDGGSVLASNLLVSTGPGISSGTAFVQEGGRLIATNGTSTIGGTGFVSGGLTITNGGFVQLKDVVVADGTFALGNIQIYTGSTNEILGTLTLGNHIVAESQGAIWLDGGLLLVTNGLTTIGNAGRGVLTVYDGVWKAADVHVGEQPSLGHAPYLTIYGGQSQIAGTLSVGIGSNTYAFGAINGGTLEAANEIFGSFGVARFSQSAGTNTVGGNLVLGAQPGSQGNYELNGGLLVASNEFIGLAGDAGFSQFGGTNTVAGVLQIGAAAGNEASYSLFGGKLVVTNAGAYINIKPTGLFTNYGGNLDCVVLNEGGFAHQGGPFNAQLVNRGTFAMTADFAPSEGVVNHTGMTIPTNLTLSADGAGFDNRGNLVLEGGVLAGSGPLVNTGIVGGHGIISNRLGNAGVIEAANGRLTLAGSVTNHAAGTLQVDDGGTLTIAAGLSRNDGLIVLYGGTLDNAGHTLTNANTLAGNGTVEGSVVNDATIAPGHSPGALSFTGDLTLGSGSTLAMELAGNTPPLYDRILVGGALSFNGSLQVLAIDGFAPAAGDSFDLLDFTSESGCFTATNLPALGAGLAWDTSQLNNTGALNVVAIPEPATLAMLLLTFGLLYRWRNRH